MQRVTAAMQRATATHGERTRGERPGNSTEPRGVERAQAPFTACGSRSLHAGYSSLHGTISRRGPYDNLGHCEPRELGR